MNIIKPQKLKIGDTIGLLSVSGDIREPQRIENAKQYFQKKGYNVVVSDTTYLKDRYFAGTDKQRLKALHSFFSDEQINAIVCTRGGYGAIRLIKDIDYSIIRNNPKIFVGYSDITAILAMIYKKTGIITFHGAMANGDFGCDDVESFTEKNFFEALCGETSCFFAGEDFKVYNGGGSCGLFWGGNLATLASLAGQDFIPDDKFVLFLEDLNEPVYKIDRMLRQLINIDKFKNNMVGLALGKFSQLDNFENYDLLLKELANELTIPICSGFLISHERKKMTVPIGITVDFNATEGKLVFKESFFEYPQE